MTTTKPTRPSVKLVAGHATTTSTAVAQFFGKRHDNIIRAIESLLKNAPPDKADWCLLNFAEASREVEQPNGGKITYTEYQLTRDAFSLLAMGFTGKEAFAWKIKYIEAFNKLEERATQRAVVVATRKIAADQAAERRKSLPAPEQSLEALAMQQLTCKRFVLQFGEKGNAILTRINDDMRLMTLEQFEETLKRSGKVVVPIEAIRMMLGVTV